MFSLYFLFYLFSEFCKASAFPFCVLFEVIFFYFELIVDSHIVVRGKYREILCTHYSVSPGSGTLSNYVVHYYSQNFLLMQSTSLIHPFYMHVCVYLVLCSSVVCRFQYLSPRFLHVTLTFPAFSHSTPPIFGHL
jgi:hypothetical protein